MLKSCVYVLEMMLRWNFEQEKKKKKLVKKEIV